MRWISLFLLLSCACRYPAAESWPIAQYGTLADALHGGAPAAGVELGRVTTPHSVGLGIAEGLAAEIAVVDGEVWVGRTENATGYALEYGPNNGRKVSFLALAEVARWREITLARDISWSELDDRLAGAAKANGLGERWPFVIQGRFDELDAHILRGACPRADPSAPEPVRSPWKRADGRLVGFFASDAGGELTHHGECTHVHVVLDRPTLFVGHVDSVTVLAGATLRLPIR